MVGTACGLAGERHEALLRLESKLGNLEPLIGKNLGGGSGNSMLMDVIFGRGEPGKPQSTTAVLAAVTTQNMAAGHAPFSCSGGRQSGAMGLAVLGLALALAPAGFGELEGRGLQGSSPLRGAKLQTARLEPAQAPRKRPTLKKVSSELARNGLTSAKVLGAVSSIPPSRLGELFFGVAKELEQLEGGVTETAVGYYMAVLTDPSGANYLDAKRKIREIVLQHGLPHEQAVRLYDGGLATLMNLYRLKLGVSREGVVGGLRDLREVKLAYQTQRRDKPDEGEGEKAP